MGKAYPEIPLHGLSFSPFFDIYLTFYKKRSKNIQDMYKLKIDGIYLYG